MFYSKFLAQQAKFGFWVASWGLSVNTKHSKVFLKFPNFLRSLVLRRLVVWQLAHLYFGDNNLIPIGVVNFSGIIKITITLIKTTFKD